MVRDTECWNWGFEDVFFINENYGVAVGGNSICITTDSGYNWTRTFYLYGILFDDVAFVDI